VLVSVKFNTVGLVRWTNCPPHTPTDDVPDNQILLVVKDVLGAIIMAPFEVATV